MVPVKFNQSLTKPIRGAIIKRLRKTFANLGYMRNMLSLIQIHEHQFTFRYASDAIVEALGEKFESGIKNYILRASALIRIKNRTRFDPFLLFGVNSRNT